GCPSQPSCTDVVVVPVGQLPDLTVIKSHSGIFVQGQSGGFYSLLVSNVGGGPTFGTVTLTDSLPAGLVATAISGGGWNCVLATLTCTRADVLSPGVSYPPVTLAV